MMFKLFMLGAGATGVVGEGQSTGTLCSNGRLARGSAAVGLSGLVNVFDLRLYCDVTSF